MRRKRSKTAFIAMLIGSAYAFFAVSYWFGGELFADTSNTAVSAGVGIATALTFPHTLTSALGALSNIIGVVFNSRAFILVAAIFYTVSLFLFPVYFMFVILQMILCFVAFSRMKYKEG